MNNSLGEIILIFFPVSRLSVSTRQLSPFCKTTEQSISELYHQPSSHHIYVVQSIKIINLNEHKTRII